MSYADDYGAGGYYAQQAAQAGGSAGGPVSITQRLRTHGGLSIAVGEGNRGRVSPQMQQQEYGYDGRYGYAEDEAHDILEGEDERGSDEEVAEQLQVRNPHGQQQLHQDQQYYDDGGDEALGGQEEDIEDDSGSFSDSLSSSPSIPDEDIDFNLVYALHTFLATVDGQASVVKGDKLLLLDDSNSYWWLVRVLKTQAIGYIPAENIETPWERLARLNKHRNVDLTTATQQDVITGPTSTTAQTRFRGRIPPSQQPHPHQSQHPYSKGIPASPSHKDHPRNISPQPEGRPGSSKAKTVLFTAPTYYAHSASGLTTDEESGMEGDDGEYDEEEEEMEHEGGRGGFDEDEDEDMEDEEIDDGHQAGGEESEFSDDGGETIDDHAARVADADDGDAETLRGHGSSLADELASRGDGEDEAARREHWERERAAAMQAQQQAAAAEAQWARQKEEERGLELQQQRSQSPSSGSVGSQGSPQQLPSVLQPGGKPSLSPQTQHAALDASLGLAPPVGGKRSLSPRLESDGVSPAYSPTQRSPGATGASTFDEFVSAPTKKLSATPPIARAGDDFADPEAAPYDARVQQQQQQQQQAGSPSSAPSQPQRVRGVDLVDPKDPRYHRMLQPTKQAGEDVLYERMVQQQHAAQQAQAASVSSSGRRSSEYGGTEGDTSLASVDTGASSILSEGSAGSTSAPSGKRASTGGKDANGADKKRKSGGGILGLFRKKDKKKKGSAAAQEPDEPRSSEESARASPTASGGSFSRKSGSASPASPRTSGERSSSQTSAPTSTSSKRESATAESMFSMDAALRQQELEAKQALYQQYGVHRNPGDLSNTMTPRGGVGVGAGGLPMSVSHSQTSSLGGDGAPRSSTGSNRNSLQLLTHPASIVGANGVLHSPSAGGGLAPPQRPRPGSLIGSPSIPGLEVPLLSVMRVFAGDHVDSEATFKTVLLNQGTTAADLVKQSMQRFRLVGADLTREEFYLTVKEIGGEERALEDDEKPLEIFEDLSERAGDDMPPSVKRSSIGSITSISSNLSLNPAISRLGMNDWSDDSAVKFYLNRRGGPTPTPLHDGPAQIADEPLSPAMQQDGARGEGLDSSGDHAATPTPGGSSPLPPTQQLAPHMAPQPSYRFAVRILIHPADLPDSVVFDPNSNAIIPKAVLLERQQRAGGSADANGASSVSPHAREKIIFFPRNANVSEVVEAALDRFGILDGVVDGGDEVEDRVSRRRSNTRAKYSLAAEEDDHEILLNASSKLLEAYAAPPMFKTYDRSSKRRSVDATLVLGTRDDVQPSDPVFILRRSAQRTSSGGIAARGPHPQTIDELEERQQQRAREEEQEVLPSPSPASASTSPVPSAGSSVASQRDLIAAQRAASRANQRAILSAQKNSDQGVDINIPEQGTIRSSRDAVNDEVRYSFINQDGQEVDISEIVENEWSNRSPQGQSFRAETATPTGGSALRPSPALSRTISAAPSTDGAESFRTAREGPAYTDDEDEQQAIDALKSTSVDVDLAGTAPYQRLQPQASSSSLSRSVTASSPPPPQHPGDILQNALGPRAATSPVFNESLQERLDRVLARVKDEKARRAASPAPSGGRPRSYISATSGGATPSGRLSPAAGMNGRRSDSPQLNGSTSRSQSSLSGRRSPLGTADRGRDSPTIDQILQHSPRSAASPTPRTDSRQQRHAKKPSVASLSPASGASSVANTLDQPSTPITGSSAGGNGTHGSAFTPASSTNSNHPPLAPQIVYPDDFGYETLAAIVEAEARPQPRPARSETDQALEGLFGRELDGVRAEVREVYEAPRKAFSDLDARLDALLLELVAV
ncbi:hypothetical protein JCM10213_004494 [Rhodosporidiobolus nylandii]